MDDQCVKHHQIYIFIFTTNFIFLFKTLLLYQNCLCSVCAMMKHSGAPVSSSELPKTFIMVVNFI